MKNIPVLRYNDLRDLMYLTHEHHLNGVVVDDAAFEVMLRIEKTMQRLEEMGDDEQRWHLASVIAWKRLMLTGITGIRCLRLTIRVSTT